MELDQLESPVAVRRLHERKLHADALEPNHPVHPAAIDRSLARQLQSELDEEPGLVRIERLLVGRNRARPVDVDGDTRAIRRRFDELQVQRGGQVLEQGQPGAECGRLDHQSVLVDEPES